MQLSKCQIQKYFKFTEESCANAFLKAVYFISTLITPFALSLYPILQTHFKTNLFGILMSKRKLLFCLEFPLQ